ncbi:tripartite tricarboxylate transporter substrate binding protein [Pelistega europaea]|uniref:Tripartite tricarboxylate transporter substrate binding protein n=1 Tax=Pelistega europaea TaxID=106147 RepID=A0A7Y4LAC9_9BURK|nr:tripartite tricarboxylate transporter substrate binding protein [Pelistega europaea]NOL49895.1 tripartite tricarboxylate transporter substrate binding protein [Pelistega europaea]
MKTRLLQVVAGVVFSLGAVGVVFAAYPEKPITMNVAYSPGGGNDTIARLMAKHIEKYLGVKVVVENNPGAGGQIGFTKLAKAKPDGYTIGLLSAPSVFMIELLRPSVGYTLNDFQPIANVQSDPIVLAVEAKSDLNTLEDAVAFIRNNPGKVNVGGDGPQSNVQLQAVAFEKVLKTKVNFISYPGSGPATTGLLGKEVDMALLTASSVQQYVQAKRVKVLGVFSDKTLPSLSGVKTVTAVLGKEVPSVGTAMRGVAAPHGLSSDKVDFLDKAFRQLLNDSEFQQAASKMGIVLDYQDHAAFTESLNKARENTKQYIDVMK